MMLQSTLDKPPIHPKTLFSKRIDQIGDKFRIQKSETPKHTINKSELLPSI
jgi:hypothetical protein